MKYLLLLLSCLRPKENAPESNRHGPGLESQGHEVAVAVELVSTQRRTTVDDCEEDRVGGLATASKAGGKGYKEKEELELFRAMLEAHPNPNALFSSSAEGRCLLRNAAASELPDTLTALFALDPLSLEDALARVAAGHTWRGLIQLPDAPPYGQLQGADGAGCCGEDLHTYPSAMLVTTASVHGTNGGGGAGGEGGGGSVSWQASPVPVAPASSLRQALHLVAFPSLRARAPNSSGQVAAAAAGKALGGEGAGGPAVGPRRRRVRGLVDDTGDGATSQPLPQLFRPASHADVLRAGLIRRSVSFQLQALKEQRMAELGAAVATTAPTSSQRLNSGRRLDAATTAAGAIIAQATRAAAAARAAALALAAEAAAEAIAASSSGGVLSKARAALALRAEVYDEPAARVGGGGGGDDGFSIKAVPASCFAASSAASQAAAPNVATISSSCEGPRVAGALNARRTSTAVPPIILLPLSPITPSHRSNLTVFSDPQQKQQQQQQEGEGEELEREHDSLPTAGSRARGVGCRNAPLGGSQSNSRADSGKERKQLRESASIMSGPPQDKAASASGSPAAPQSRRAPLQHELAEALTTSTFGRHHRQPVRRATFMAFSKANGSLDCFVPDRFMQSPEVNGRLSSPQLLTDEYPLPQTHHEQVKQPTGYQVAQTSESPCLHVRSGSMAFSRRSYGQHTSSQSQGQAQVQIPYPNKLGDAANGADALRRSTTMDPAKGVNGRPSTAGDGLHSYKSEDLRQQQMSQGGGFVMFDVASPRAVCIEGADGIKHAGGPGSQRISLSGPQPACGIAPSCGSGAGSSGGGGVLPRVLNLAFSTSSRVPSRGRNRSALHLLQLNQQASDGPASSAASSNQFMRASLAAEGSGFAAEVEVAGAISAIGDAGAWETHTAVETQMPISVGSPGTPLPWLLGSQGSAPDSIASTGIPRMMSRTCRSRFHQEGESSSAMPLDPIHSGRLPSQHEGTKHSDSGRSAGGGDVGVGLEGSSRARLQASLAEGVGMLLNPHSSTSPSPSAPNDTRRSNCFPAGRASAPSGVGRRVASGSSGEAHGGSAGAGYRHAASDTFAEHSVATYDHAAVEAAAAATATVALQVESGMVIGAQEEEQEEAEAGEGWEEDEDKGKEGKQQESGASAITFAAGKSQDRASRDIAAMEMEVWHEVAVSGLKHPTTGEQLILVTQHDVSARVWAEQQLARVMEAEHALLEAIFPAHVLEHIAIMAAAPADAINRDGAVQGAREAAAAVAAANALTRSRPQTLENVIAHATAAATEAGLGGLRGMRASPAPAASFADPAPLSLTHGSLPITGDTFLHLATSHTALTVLFCDIQGFTAMCNVVRPGVVMAFLNDLFTRLDAMLDAFGVYKVETIGDCYMVAGGLMKVDEETGAVTVRSDDVDPQHAHRTVQFGKALLRAASSVRLPTTGETVRLRVGIHSGPAMSGVVGTRMPRFCLFGDTINTASRMESTGESGAIHVSQATRDLVPGEAWEATGGVQAKGKGRLETYILRPPGNT